MTLGVAIDFETLTLGTSAEGLSAQRAGRANRAWLTVEGGGVRYRLDGVDPTATVGHELADGGSLELEHRDQVQRARFIATDATATLRASFFL